MQHLINIQMQNSKKTPHGSNVASKWQFSVKKLPFTGGKKRWHYYSDETNTDIENMYMKYTYDKSDKHVLHFMIGLHPYEVDIIERKQYGTGTRRTRNIRRIRQSNFQNSK